MFGGKSNHNPRGIWCAYARVPIGKAVAARAHLSRDNGYSVARLRGLSFLSARRGRLCIYILRIVILRGL